MRAAGEDGGRLQHVLELCRLYARIHRPVVLLGPVGSGKTTLAREIHRLSELDGPLIEASAGELTETLFADTLFGHERGAFTGASVGRVGAVGQARNGTLLLDDLALMPLVVQAAILRVSESGYYRPLGAESDVAADCRLLFATTEPLPTLVERGRLLPDLASRLGELVITIPPLRGRRADIMALAVRAGRAMVREHGHSGEVVFSDEAKALLEEYSWPNNVRELQAVAERAVIHAGISAPEVRVRAAHLPPRLRRFDADREKSPRLTPAVVEAVLRETGGNQTEAARRLGVHRNTVGRYARDAG